MKNIKLLIPILFFTLLLSSCSKKKEYSGKSVGKPMDYTIFNKNNFESLGEIYYNHGNYINSKRFPPIILAPAVFNDGKDWLLIDIRSKDAYEAGHINGAYNVPKEKLVEFLTVEHKASAYEKVVIIGYSGQLASYVTGVLRYGGFDNAYVMLYGMGAWNSEFSGVLTNGYSNKYAQMMEKSEVSEHHSQHEAEETHKPIKELEEQLPKLSAVAHPSNFILERAKKLLKKPRKEFLVKADELFPQIKENPDKYYTLFYWNKKKFDEGHLRNTKFFKLRKDLSLDHKLVDLPKDKPILLYCKTGHTGGSAVAYLDMLGYDAHNLAFGYNSFANNPEAESVADVINEFPVLAGKKRLSNKVIKVAKKKTSIGKRPLIKRKKKSVSGGCG